MKYLVFDQDGEMLDVLDFESIDTLALYKAENPTYIIKNEDSLLDEDNFIFEDDPFDLFEDD